MGSTSYVNEAHLNKLGVKCADIDIETGTPADGGPKLIDLIPIDQLDAITEKTDMHRDNAISATVDHPLSNIHEARFVGYFFLYGLFNSILKAPNKSVLDCSPWVVFER